ncbi:MAG: prolyl oligopeptidase family serine peptidase [Candidatus Hydrogenedentota bacterium]
MLGLVACGIGLGMAPLESEANGGDYLWLEEIEGEDALEWVEQQNEPTLRALEGDPGFEARKTHALEIVQDEDRIPGVAIRGKYVYNFWQDEDHIRGIWRRMPWEDFIEDSEDWEILLDVDKLAEEEEMSWVWQGANFLRPEYERCLVSLSDGGKDASYLREFDVERQAFVEDGFKVPEAKTSTAWLDRDRVFISTAWFEDAQTASGYARTTRLWERGQPLEEAPVIFEGEVDDVSVSASVSHDADEKHVILRRGKTFHTQKLFYFDGESAQPLDLPEHISVEGLIQGHLVFRLREDDLGFGKGTVVSTPLDALEDGEAPDPVPVFEPTDRQATLRGQTRRTGDALLLVYLDDVRGRAARFHPPADENGAWRKEPIELPDRGRPGIMAADDETDRALLTYQDFLTPPSLLLLDPDTLETETLRKEPAHFDADGLTAEQYFAESADGTRIPYFVVHNPERTAEGPSPTALNGYGGFEISMTPGYVAIPGRLWLEQGGAYVVANIRGGGEYGPEWHQAALKENRQKAFDDFIAVAEDLVERGITTPEQLGILGGSNGGLLVGAAFTQRPELFGAVVCQVPLLDMLRYHKLPPGASWMAEYGDPEDPELAPVIEAYSPFHNLRTDADYPEVFFVTSTKDDRVHPGHARKMAARMLDMGHSVYYYENIEGGHGASADDVQRAKRHALEYTYLWRQLGAPGE